jgi:formylglycine-generating enzyme required for sulfatase activity
MAGGVTELTADRMLPRGPTPDGGRVVIPDGSADGEDAWLGRTATHLIVGRGGSRIHHLNAVRSAFRLGIDPWALATNVGFRLARPL